MTRRGGGVGFCDIEFNSLFVFHSQMFIFTRIIQNEVIFTFFCCEQIAVHTRIEWWTV